MATQTETITLAPLDSHSEDEKQHPLALTGADSETLSYQNRRGQDSVEAAPDNSSEKPPRDLHGIIWILVVVSVLSADFLFALDNTIVADVQPKIILDLGEVGKLPWVSVAFALGGVAVNLIW